MRLLRTSCGALAIAALLAPAAPAAPRIADPGTVHLAYGKPALVLALFGRSYRIALATVKPATATGATRASGAISFPRRTFGFPTVTLPPVWAAGPAAPLTSAPKLATMATRFTTAVGGTLDPAKGTVRFSGRALATVVFSRFDGPPGVSATVTCAVGTPARPVPFSLAATGPGAVPYRQRDGRATLVSAKLTGTATCSAKVAGLTGPTAAALKAQLAKDAGATMKAILSFGVRLIVPTRLSPAPKAP